MADINSQLPVKLTDGSLTASIRDTGSNDSLNVAIVDASGNQVTSFGSAATQYTEDAASAGAESLMLAGAVRRDTAASSAGTDGDYATLNTDANGALWVKHNGTVTVDNGGTFAVQVDAALPAGTNAIGKLAANSGVDIGDVDVLSLPDVTQSTHDSLNANANIQVNDTDVAETNPVPVYITSGAASGSEVNDYDTASAVAASGTDNHDYTVVNTTFLLKQITFAASGKMKVELQTGPVAGLASKGVWFISTANPSYTITFAQPIEVPSTSTGTVRLIRTNLEASAMDVYSTIIGSDI